MALTRKVSLLSVVIASSMVGIGEGWAKKMRDIEDADRAQRMCTATRSLAKVEFLLEDQVNDRVRGQVLGAGIFPSCEKVLAETISSEILVNNDNKWKRDLWDAQFQLQESLRYVHRKMRISRTVFHMRNYKDQQYYNESIQHALVMIKTGKLRYGDTESGSWLTAFLSAWENYSEFDIILNLIDDFVRHEEWYARDPKNAMRSVLDEMRDEILSESEPFGPLDGTPLGEKERRICELVGIVVPDSY